MPLRSKTSGASVVLHTRCRIVVFPAFALPMIRILKRGILLRMRCPLSVSAISNEYEEAFEWWRAAIEPKVAVGHRASEFPRCQASRFSVFSACLALSPAPTAEYRVAAAVTLLHRFNHLITHLIAQAPHNLADRRCSHYPPAALRLGCPPRLRSAPAHMRLGHQYHQATAHRFLPVMSMKVCDCSLYAPYL